MAPRGMSVEAKVLTVEHAGTGGKSGVLDVQVRVHGIPVLLNGVFTLVAPDVGAQSRHIANPSLVRVSRTSATGPRLSPAVTLWLRLRPMSRSIPDIRPIRSQTFARTGACGREWRRTRPQTASFCTRYSSMSTNTRTAVGTDTIAPRMPPSSTPAKEQPGLPIPEGPPCFP